MDAVWQQMSIKHELVNDTLKLNTSFKVFRFVKYYSKLEVLPPVVGIFPCIPPSKLLTTGHILFDKFYIKKTAIHPSKKPIFNFPADHRKN